MQDFDVYSCLVNQSGRLIRFVCGLDSRGSDLPSQPRYTSHGIQANAIDPWTQTRALISSPTPASLWDLRFPCCPSLTPSQVPATPAGRPPSSHQLQPIPCSAGPSLCDPGGYWVREVRGGSPYCYPRHLLEVSAPEALRPCRATPTWPSASEGSEKSPPPPVLVSNGLSQSLSSGRRIVLHLVVIFIHWSTSTPAVISMCYTKDAHNMLQICILDFFLC